MNCLKYVTIVQGYWRETKTLRADKILKLIIEYCTEKIPIIFNYKANIIKFLQQKKISIKPDLLFTNDGVGVKQILFNYPLNCQKIHEFSVNIKINHVNNRIKIVAAQYNDENSYQYGYEKEYYELEDGEFIFWKLLLNRWNQFENDKLPSFVIAPSNDLIEHSFYETRNEYTTQVYGDEFNKITDYYKFQIYLYDSQDSVIIDEIVIDYY